MNRPLVAVFCAAALLAACGVDEHQDVKSADAWLAEQEQEGAKQMADEKKRKRDEKQADLELKRAARSAETCPESVTEKAPKGKATVTLTFANDGRVKESKIGD